MSKREFSKVSPELWSAPAFTGLSDRAKLAFLYLLAGPHVNQAGCYRLQDAYAAADLNWSVDEWASIRNELIEKRLIDHDPETHEVLIVGPDVPPKASWWGINKASNDSHAKGVREAINGIASVRLSALALAEFEAVDAKRPPDVSKRRRTESEGIDQAVDRPRREFERLAGTISSTGLPIPSRSKQWTPRG